MKVTWVSKLVIWRRWGTQKKARWIGYFLTFAVLITRLANLFEGPVLRDADFHFWLRGEVAPTAPCVIVAVDNESFNEVAVWPWPRSLHGRVIRQIMKGRPKAIVFDVLFTDPAPDPRQDAELAAAARAAGCVIMGAEVVHGEDRQFTYDELKLPVPVLRNAIYSPGLTNTPQDSDAFVRRTQLFQKVHDERHFSLAMEALRRYLGVGKGEINLDGAILEFGDRRIPLDQDQRMRINYCGPAKTFRTIPYYQVLKGIVDPSVFKDCIVFVGATAADLHDVFFTPFSWSPLPQDRAAVQMPGVEIHANVIDTILNDRYVYDPPTGVVPLLIVALGLLISYVAIRYKIWVALAASLGATVVLSVLSYLLFAYRSVFLETVHPLMAVFATLLGCVTYRAAVEMREKQKVRATFARYVSPHVLTTVLSSPPELGGARRVATILFSDVRGFTSMSEKLTAHEVVGILNEYLTEMVGVVLAHDGTLDKFVGDAVMAVFGSPVDQPDHALRAVSTAWHMHVKHAALKEKWTVEGKVPFDIGIGVNTGEVVAGNMGSPNRMEFTVIGDNVNLAARLESATKEAHAKILISESTYALVRDHVQVKEHDPIHVKGKEQAVKMFELLGVDEVVSAGLQKPAAATDGRGAKERRAAGAGRV